MGEGKRALQVRTREEVHVEAQGPPTLVDPPAPEIEQQAPTQEELEQRVRGWERWGGHKSHLQPNRWPRWLQRLGHPHQVREEPARRKLQPTVGGQDPPEGVPQELVR